MNRPLRMAIVGCGKVSKQHVQGWQNAGVPVDIRLLVDIKPENAQKLKADTKLESAIIATDYRRALEDESIDAVELCTYSDLHTEQIIAALEAGKHVMTEKPVGYSLEDCRRLRWVRQKYPEPKVQVAYSLRYYPVNQAIRREVLAGTIGKVMFASVTYNHAMHEERDPFAGGDHVAGDSGGRYIAGSEMTGATHPWDLARYLLGEVKDVFSVQGVGTFAMLRHVDGVVCQVTAGSTAKGGAVAPVCVCIQGTKGTAFTSYTAGLENWEKGCYRGYIVTDRKQRDITPEQTDTGHGDLTRCRNFYNGIFHGEELICDMLDAIRTSELLHAIRDSHDHEIRVPVHRTGKTG